LSASLRAFLLQLLLLTFLFSSAAAQAPAPGPERLAPLSYDAIIERDLFRPSRGRWVPPPPPRTPPPRPGVKAAPKPRRQAASEPKFILHGVGLGSDGTKIVVLEEAKLTKGRILPFRIGDSLGPYRIKEIHPKGTVLEGPSKSINLTLRGEVPSQVKKGLLPEGD
jgi:hypothetical protein